MRFHKNFDTKQLGNFLAYSYQLKHFLLRKACRKWKLSVESSNRFICYTFFCFTLCKSINYFRTPGNQVNLPNLPL